ncbi:peptidase, S41 family [Sphingobacterium spiritivorum ATCC 33300]|uniref:Peptidase, S41 family n=2 Tax=Sphingobacterium spiritivorum TaxID=258 RepID=C2G0Z0_SPHSI|nr:carboxy-terminal processing peptidase [Sphingobacterium spiritivorum]EEI91220.1 peptidase, S41 family [Sphingobacterium spiritivorum ATCC 33300]
MSALTDAVDPHTTYYNPSFAQAFNEGMSNTFEGIGARLMIDNEAVTISEVLPGGPAFRDKSLHMNDKIIGVAQGEKGEFEDIIGWRLDAAVAKIKGPKGTIVRLKIIPAGQEMTAQPKIVSLKREKIVVEEESAKKEIKMVKGDDGKTYKIGVINLPKFYIDFDAYRKRDPNYKSTTRDVRLILDTLKQEKVDAVILDLRSNGGGSLQEAIELTGLFIDKGPVVQVRDTRNRIEVDNDEEAGMAWSGPFGVIINRFSASASEIFAGAIQDYGRGLILGSQSYGKGTVQSAVDMSRFISATSRLLLKAEGEKDPDTPNGAPEFGQINITMGKFYRINGSSTQHKGVSPDITFPTQFSAEKFGESSEPAALPWDQIKSTNFKKVANLDDVVKKLETIHKARMEKSQEYKFLLEDIDAFNKLDSVPKVTLNEAKLKKEREANKVKNRNRINEELKLHGKPVWKEGEPQPKIDFDYVMDESANIMVDFLKHK